MKILYVTAYDSSDINQWSGLGYYIRRALEMSGMSVRPFQVTGGADSFAVKAKRRLYDLASRRYLPEREPRVVKEWSRQVEREAKSARPDIIFSPGSTPVAYVDTHHPLVIYGDATFDGLVEIFPWYSNLTSETKRNGHAIEQAALDRSWLALFASEWAAQTAVNYYGKPSEKVGVVPFGANIECNRTAADVEALIARRGGGECRLLFAGVDWKNKGGDFAVRVAEELNRRGLKTSLDVLGCTPSSALPPFVSVHGYVSKRSDEGRNKIDELFSKAHFLILPTVADCYGVVFCEASSFGVPSLTNAVGGTTTPVRTGQNGAAFSLDAQPEEWCDAVEEIWPHYAELARSSFAEYQSRLNWDVAARKLQAFLSTL